MIYITVPDMNDSISNIALDGVNYKIRFTYNEKYDFWSFGILSEDGKNIVSMTKIVPGFPLLYAYTNDKLPRGVFGCISDTDKVGRNSFINNEAQFAYITQSEVVNG